MSASFPYIKLSKEQEASDESSASSSGSKAKAKAKAGASSSSMPRLGPMTSQRQVVDPVRAAAAAAVLMGIIREQTLAAHARGGGGGGSEDPMALDAPWRSDDSLISPEIVREYTQYPAVVDAILETGLRGQQERKEFTRYIALARFGEVEQNAWKILKRVCKQKKDERVRTNMDTHTHTHAAHNNRVCSARVHLPRQMLNLLFVLLLLSSRPLSLSH